MLPKIIFFLTITGIALFSTPNCRAQSEVKLEVRFSKQLAVLEFIEKLTAHAAPNPYKKIFAASNYQTNTYTDLIKQYEDIQIDFEYPFTQYPDGQKIEGSTGNILKRNLIITDNLAQFKLQSLGVIPNADIISLTNILEAFTPVYEKLIYEPNKAIFENQLEAISNLLVKKSISVHFEKVRKFYNAAWDTSIPFLFVFYPLPESKGFTATAFTNMAVSAFPTSLTDYNAMLSVLLHEISHILYDEQSLSMKHEVNNWFIGNSWKYNDFARTLSQEAFATAVGNGYFFEQLSGMLNPGSWYNWKYNNLMAKQIYPEIKKYLEADKSLDKNFIDYYVKTYEQYFSEWVFELDNLMTGRMVITDSSTHTNYIDRKYRYYHIAKNLPFTKKSLEEMYASTHTKVIIISGNNKEKLDLVTKTFQELNNWSPDANKDFSYTKFLDNKSFVIIINLVNNGFPEAWERLKVGE